MVKFLRFIAITLGVLFVGLFLAVAVLVDEKIAGSQIDSRLFFGGFVLLGAIMLMNRTSRPYTAFLPFAVFGSVYLISSTKTPGESPLAFAPEQTPALNPDEPVSLESIFSEAGKRPGVENAQVYVVNRQGINRVLRRTKNDARYLHIKVPNQPSAYLFDVPLDHEGYFIEGPDKKIDSFSYIIKRIPLFDLCGPIPSNNATSWFLPRRWEGETIYRADILQDRYCAVPEINGLSCQRIGCEQRNYADIEPAGPDYIVIGKSNAVRFRASLLR
ncbi:MAG: hypothetical protein AAFR88_09030 [Pseudomonadota bacterium]